MNIAFATFRYYPFGGLEQSMRNIALEVLRRGHNLTIYCQAWQGEPLPHAKLEILPVKNWSNHGRMLAFVRQFKQRIATQKHDLVVGFKRMPGLDLYYNGDVCFCNEIAVKRSPLVRFTPRYKVLGAFEEAVFSPASSTHIMYISEREKQIFQDFYGTSDFRFHALPPGIDKTRIRDVCTSEQRNQTRSDMNVSGDSLLILMVGSDFQRKGVDRAIYALAALPAGIREKARLWVVGKGKQGPFERLAKNLGIRNQVFFLGPRNNVPALLAAADILVHPSLTETAGNAIIEGLVAGVPVIVSESAGFSVHVARARGGLVVPDIPWRQSLFDQALFKLASDKVLRSQMGEHGLNYAEVTDLYHRPQVAADIIESLAEERADADLAG